MTGCTTPRDTTVTANVASINEIAYPLLIIMVVKKAFLASR
jgi:hypothetical protein